MRTLPDGTPHHWRRVQKRWAHRAWLKREPEEAARVHARFARETSPSPAQTQKLRKGR